jgi:prepilin peptidase CpaA
MNPEQMALAAAATVALVAAVFDARSRRIPNWLSASALAGGLLFRGLGEGAAGLTDAAAGFAIGALPLLVLWLIGSGGGGDVKLMGALSVWLGYQQSVLLLVGSAVAVLIVHVVVVTWQGLRPHAGGERQPKLRIAFAVPVCLAAWVLVATNVLQHVARS